MKMWIFGIAVMLISGLAACSTVPTKSRGEDEKAHRDKRWETPGSLSRGSKFNKWEPGATPPPPGRR